MPMRIPFDSLCLTAVVAELQPWIGARVQGVRQPDALTLVIGLYAGKETGLLLSADAEYARAHLVTRRPGKMAEPPAFGLEVRRRLDGARLARCIHVLLNSPAQYVKVTDEPFVA